MKRQSLVEKRKASLDSAQKEKRERETETSEPQMKRELSEKEKQTIWEITRQIGK